MRKLGLLMLALSLGACASSGTLKAQGWRNSYYGSYGTTAYSYGWTARPRSTPPETTRGETSATLEAEVLAEINRVRTHPQRYAEHLRAYRAYYHGDVVRAPVGPSSSASLAAEARR
jgi:hypothetical protein